MSRLLLLLVFAQMTMGQTADAQQLALKDIPLEELRERAESYFSLPAQQERLARLGVAQDYVGITADKDNFVWLYRETRPADDPELVRKELAALSTEMLRNTPGRDPISTEGLTFMMSLDTSPSVQRSLFVYPTGLSTSPELLFSSLGHRPGYSVPMTAEYCFDLAYACWIRGNAADAIVLAKHGLMRRNDARLHLLLGVCLLEVNRPQLAEATALDYRHAMALRSTYGLNHAIERINGPLRPRFDAIVQYQAQTIPAAPLP